MTRGLSHGSACLYDPKAAQGVSSRLAESRSCKSALLNRHNQEMPDLKLTVIDSNALPWEERPNEKIGRSLYRKNLIVDPETGMEVRLVRYPAGAINPLHTHPCAHGMYVLEGTLVTHDGQYGPGHFVWFPEGSLMEHGATAEQDVTVLFITNKSFEIHYR